jgi:hypothetical protein
MVRQGNFVLEVVYADSKDPFQEHYDASKGKTYAEVEPDTDYFIRVTKHGAREVIMDYTVDGKSLGYSTLFIGNEGLSCDRGLLRMENGRTHYTALRFNKLFRAKRNKAPDGDYEGNWTGCIEVDVHEYITLEGQHVFQERSSNWTSNSEQILAGLDLSSNKKACNSTKGKVKSDSKTESRLRQNYKRGSKLATLQLHYCSTVGLFAAGILKRPPKPNVSQIRSTIHTNAGDADNDEEDISSKRRRVSSDGNVQISRVTKTEPYEVLDLTNGDDDNDANI